jgi:hypothetical protein
LVKLAVIPVDHELIQTSEMEDVPHCWFGVVALALELLKTMTVQIITAITKIVSRTFPACDQESGIKFLCFRSEPEMSYSRDSIGFVACRRGKYNLRIDRVQRKLIAVRSHVLALS